MESDEIDVPDVTASEQSVPPPAVPAAHAGMDRLADLRLLLGMCHAQFVETTNNF